MVAEKIYDLLPDDLPKVIGDLPATKTSAVAIIEYDGAVSTEYFGPSNGSTIFGPIVKIVIRDKSYSKGQEWANLIRNTLHRYHDDYFLSIMVVGTPVYLGRSVDKLSEFQVTFKTQVKE